ncbi:hypothetical protein LTS08_003342 [Lithohypha guttulata]|nr:hypothetical protein LTS08_003342 [Lithohypha guttulata]
MSDWSLAPASHAHVSILGHKAQLHELGKKHMLAAQQNDEFVVECCTIQNGGFLEYFVQGCGDLELQAGLEDDLMLEYIDIGNRKLVIPCVETGEPARVTMTSLRDIANFVAASLDLPRGVMTGQIGTAGWTGTFENVADVLKRLEPAVDVEKVYVTAEECGNKAEEYGQTFRAKIGKGDFDLVAFKEAKTADFDELLRKAWQKC